jgi:hypothetical protein
MYAFERISYSQSLVLGSNQFRFGSSCRMSNELRRIEDEENPVPEKNTTLAFIQQKTCIIA